MERVIGIGGGVRDGKTYFVEGGDHGVVSPLRAAGGICRLYCILATV